MLTQDQKYFLKRVIGDYPYQVDENDIVYVNGGVACGGINLGLMPVKFGTASFQFDCSRCGLVSLENTPRSVGVDFMCNGNDLINLVGAPVLVKGNFYCNHNNLTSLEGIEKTTVGGTFYCNDNPLVPTKELFKQIMRLPTGNLARLMGQLRANLHKHYGLSEDNPIVQQIWDEVTEPIGGWRPSTLK